MQASLHIPSAFPIEIKQINYLPFQFLAIRFGMVGTFWFSYLWELIDNNHERFFAVLGSEADYFGIKPGTDPDSTASLDAFVMTQPQRGVYNCYISPLEKASVECVFPVSANTQYPYLSVSTLVLAHQTVNLMIFKFRKQHMSN